MYFFNINALAKDLKENKVSEHEKYKYYLIVEIFSLLCGMLIVTAVSLTRSIFSLLIFPIGIEWCYKANKSGDNKNFIERMVCLSVPLTIILVLVTIAAGVLWSVIRPVVFSPDMWEMANNGFSINLHIVITFIYFIWKYKKIRYIAH